MAKRVQLIRHATAQAALFQGKEGEITVDLTNKSLRIHDGLNPGGVETALKDLSTSQAAVAGANDGKMTAAQATELATATAKDTAQDGRLDAMDVLNTAQDGRLTVNEAKSVTQDAAIASNTVNIAANIIDISSNTNDVAAHLIRLDAMDIKNTTQDGNISTNTGGLSVLQAKDPAVPGVGEASKFLQLDANKDIISLNEVKADKLTAATGILFGTDTAAANTLDDYEEGNWTPSLSDGTNYATVQGASGQYTKNGNVVYISGFINTTNAATVLSGFLRLTNLPFTVSNSSQTGISIANASGLTLPSAGQSITGWFVQNQTYIFLYLWDATSGATNLRETEFSDIGLIRFSGFYMV